MPLDVSQLSTLASTPDSGGTPVGDKTSMPSLQAMPARTPQPQVGGGEGQPAGGGEDNKMEKAAAAFKEMVANAHELMTIAPETTPIVREALKKIYLGVSDLFGVGDEAKLAMKKGAGQIQSQGMQQMGNL